MTGPFGGADEPGANPIDWDEATSGAELLDAVRDFIGRFVAFPSGAALTAATLWAAHAHLVHAGENTPRLALLSPEPGSGKTRTLEVLELLVPAPMSVLSASPAAVFRSIEAERPTLLMDEVDAVFNRRGSDDGAEDLRALLNAGHRKGATIPRCVGPRHDVVRFPVYCAVAMAGLGDLPDTLMSRSVIVRMQRRAPGERVEPFRRRLHAQDGEALRDQLTAWAAAVAQQVRDAWPEMPDGITDRPADVWEPLLAVADAAGGHWPATARAACVELAKVAVSREASLGVRLLADLREVFGDREALHTETILDALRKLDEAPWADLRGKPLDARGLARRLRQYEIRSVDVKLADVNRKGYQREHLWDAWTRYLPDPDKSATCATSATDPGSERESAPAGVADTATGSATSRAERYPAEPGSERESAVRSGGSAGSGLSAGEGAGPDHHDPDRVSPRGSEAEALDRDGPRQNPSSEGPSNPVSVCGHPASIRALNGKCAECVAAEQNALIASQRAAKVQSPPCTVCDSGLDPVLVAAGETTHPMCEASR